MFIGAEAYKVGQFSVHGGLIDKWIISEGRQRVIHTSLCALGYLSTRLIHIRQYFHRCGSMRD